MKRRTQLVCQHLENISRQALERHQDIIGQYARGRQGIYALYRRGKLYYVGLATNLRNRLQQHLKDRHGDSWDQFTGKVYTSPSMAAALACKRRTCNGWTFWQYERAPGDWVAIDKLRK